MYIVLWIDHFRSNSFEYGGWSSVGWFSLFSSYENLIDSLIYLYIWVGENFKKRIKIFNFPKLTPFIDRVVFTYVITVDFDNLVINFF